MNITYYNNHTAINQITNTIDNKKEHWASDTIWEMDYWLQ